MFLDWGALQLPMNLNISAEDVEGIFDLEDLVPTKQPAKSVEL